MSEGLVVFLLEDIYFFCHCLRVWLLILIWSIIMFSNSFPACSVVCILLLIFTSLSRYSVRLCFGFTSNLIRLWSGEEQSLPSSLLNRLNFCLVLFQCMSVLCHEVIVWKVCRKGNNVFFILLGAFSSWLFKFWVN